MLTTRPRAPGDWRTSYPRSSQSSTPSSEMYRRTSSPSLVFLPLLCTFFLAACAQPRCRPEQFLQRGKCASCPAGTYRNILDECNKCFTGAFRATEGASDPAQCIPCLAGAFQDEEGATKCKKCPKGAFSLVGSDGCASPSSCPPGTEFFGARCIPCSPGFFKNNDNIRRMCARCPSGTFTDGAGAIRCKKCPKGSFQTNSVFDSNPISVFVSNGCSQCQAGTFSNQEGATFCKLCRPGTFSKPGALGCAPCPKGQFSARIISRKCVPCPSGTFTVGKGAAACKHPKKGCRYDTFEDKNGQCQACLPGERLHMRMRRCIPCRKNEVSNGGIDISCAACPPGKRPIGPASIIEKSGCVCEPGTVDDGVGGCVPCPSGTFWENGEAFFQAVGNFKREFLQPDIRGECVTCGPGTFSNKPGMFECKQCPLNTFQDQRGATRCKPCARGFRSLFNRDDERTKCVDDLLVCGPGEVRVRGQNNRCTTVTCCGAAKCPEPGTFLNGRICDRCQRNFRFVPRLNACKLCPPGQLSEGGTSETCVPCKIGKNSELDIETDKCVCKWRFGLSNRKCVLCKAGTMSQRSQNGVVKCVKCPLGTFSNRSGTSCDSCDVGLITPAEGAKKCVPCPPGTVQERNIYGEKTNKCRSNDPYS